MPSERHRHGRRPRSRSRIVATVQRVARELGLRRAARAGTETPRSAPRAPRSRAESPPRRGRCRPAAEHAPVRRSAASTPWIGSPFGSRWTGASSGSSSDPAPVERVGARGQAVGPGVQERDAEARATLAIGGKAAPLPEQLLAAMGERVANHPPEGANAARRSCSCETRRPSRPSTFVADLVPLPSCRRLLGWRAIRGNPTLGWPADGVGRRAPALVARCARGARCGAARRAHALGPNDPDGYRCSPRGAGRRPGAHRRPRARLPDARAGRLPTGQRHGARRSRAAADGRLFAVLSARPGPLTAAGAPPLPGCRARAASSFTRAPRASISTTPSWPTCSRSPTSGGCRSSATPAAASRRSAATRSRCARATRT